MITIKQVPIYPITQQRFISTGWFQIQVKPHQDYQLLSEKEKSSQPGWLFSLLFSQGAEKHIAFLFDGSPECENTGASEMPIEPKTVRSQPPLTDLISKLGK